jgi:hypothetical protein
MNNKVEILKAEYAIIRDKLLLFAAGAGGSFTIIVNKTLPSLINFGVITILIASSIGILINLYKAGKILKKLERIENDG